jgi:L-fuconolactonase
LIDAHVHTWKRVARNERWLSEGHPATNRDFPLVEMLAHLDDEEAFGAVVVQSQDSAEETHDLLALAEAEPRILGVVGFVPLDRPEHHEVTSALTATRLIGVRTLGRIDVADAAVARTIERLADAGISLELVGQAPDVLDTAQRLSTAHPALRIVVDHFANAHLADEPDIEVSIRRLSDSANVFVKCTGMPSAPVEVFSRWFDVFTTAFGTRVMFGSDWPISLRHGDGNEPMRRCRAALAAFRSDIRSAMEHHAAAEAYPRLRSRLRDMKRNPS